MGRRNRKPVVVENISISGLADKGRGVGRDNEGRVYFVDDTVPGDKVDILVLRKKDNYFEGLPHKFKVLSDERTTPFCNHFGTCGGCQLQHIKYRSQLKYNC